MPVIHPLILKLLLSFVRYGSAYVVSRLVEHHWISPEDAETTAGVLVGYVVQASPLLAIYAWSARDTVRAHLKYIAARLTSPRATEAQVEALSKSSQIRAIVLKDLGTVDPAMIGPTVIPPPGPLFPGGYPPLTRPLPPPPPAPPPRPQTPPPEANPNTPVPDGGFKRRSK